MLLVCTKILYVDDALKSVHYSGLLVVTISHYNGLSLIGDEKLNKHYFQMSFIR